MDFQLLFLVHLCVFLLMTMYAIRFPLHFEESHLNHIWDDSRVVIPKVGVPWDVSLLIHTHFSTLHLDECLIQICSN